MASLQLTVSPVEHHKRFRALVGDANREPGVFRVLAAIVENFVPLLGRGRFFQATEKLIGERDTLWTAWGKTPCRSRVTLG